MKKTILFACIFLITCSGALTNIKDDPIEISIPSGWKSGSTGSSGSGVWVRLYSKTQGNSMESVMASLEQNLGNPARYTNSDGSIGYSGSFYLPFPDVYAQTDSIAMTMRDVYIEKTRIEQTDTSSNADPIEIAKLNVREMALVYDQAAKLELLPTDEQVKADMELNYDQAKKVKQSKQLFLANWGITEKEFENIIRQKLAYEAVIKSVTISAKSESDYIKLATQFKNQLLSTGKIELKEIVPAKIKATIFESGENIIVAIGFGSGYDLNNIARSIKITGTYIDGQPFLYGSSN